MMVRFPNIDFNCNLRHYEMEQTVDLSITLVVRIDYGGALQVQVETKV